MDFSLGGLGWLLENQLMWNNLVPLGGELHQFRGNPHYSMQRMEESTISSWLAYISVGNVPTVQSQKKISHLLLDYAFHSLSLFSTVTAALFWPWHFSFVFSVFNVTGCHLLAHLSHPLLDSSDSKICNYTNALVIDSMYVPGCAAFTRSWRNGAVPLARHLEVAGNVELYSPG